MGVARVLSGGTDGRFQIEIDTGIGVKDAELARLAARQAEIEIEIAANQILLTQAQAATEVARQLWVLQVDALVVLMQSAAPEDAISAQQQNVEATLRALMSAQIAEAPHKTLDNALKLEKASILREIAKWNTTQTVFTRYAWCADFTEEAEGETVRTIEIDGEPDHILIAPGALLPDASEPQLTAMPVMTGPQAYLNYALLPGWQKHMPTFRTAVITAIDYDNNRADVALDAATSQAQGLNINQASTLDAVPVVYMDCDAFAFEVDDHVVVQFVGQNWAMPYIIGFVDTPAECAPLKHTGFFTHHRIGNIPANDTSFLVVFRVRRTRAQSWWDDKNSLSCIVNGTTLPLEDYGTSNLAATYGRYDTHSAIVNTQVLNAFDDCPDSMIVVSVRNQFGACTFKLYFQGVLLTDVTMSIPIHADPMIGVSSTCNDYPYHPDGTLSYTGTGASKAAYQTFITYTAPT